MPSLPVGARAAAGQLAHQLRIPLTSWATLKEANDIERERFENEKKRFENDKELHDIKIAETKLKNVTAILRNPPASLSEAQLKRMRAQEVFMTGVVTGIDFGDDLESDTSAQRRKVGE